MHRRHIIPVTLIALPALVFAQGGGGGTSDLRVSGKFISDVPTGDPPLQVNSTTNVPNLNADRLDGFDVGDFAVEGSGVGVHYKNLVGVPGKEIDQDCATGAGCFAGDSGSFPVEITEPGSYRLASNLDISGETDAESLNAIEVSADGVTIDLAGFSLIGPTTCSGDPVTSCTPTGDGDGIDLRVGGAVFNVVVKNGAIRGMGQDGILSDGSTVVMNMRVTANGRAGIHFRNGYGRVTKSLVARNAMLGIIGDAHIADNTVRDNGDIGIFVQPDGIARGNHVSGNDGNGMRCAGCLAVDNILSGNTGFGLELDGSASYGRNMFYNNDDGDIIDNSTAASHEIAPNSCAGTGGAGPC